MDAVTQKSRKTPLPKPVPGVPGWLERALGVCFAGEQHVQSLCLQPGEGMSSGEDLEQQPCEI